jgi:thiamine pyrophosphate-dependent acetolactate synthase large subunit-like protein
MITDEVEVVMHCLDISRVQDVLSRASLTMYKGKKVHVHVPRDVVAQLEERNVEHEVLE